MAVVVCRAQSANLAIRNSRFLSGSRPGLYMHLPAQCPNQRGSWGKRRVKGGRGAPHIPGFCRGHSSLPSLRPPSAPPFRPTKKVSPPSQLKSRPSGAVSGTRGGGGVRPVPGAIYARLCNTGRSLSPPSPSFPHSAWEHKLKAQSFCRVVLPRRPLFFLVVLSTRQVAQ